MSRAVPIAGAGLASVVVVLWVAQGAHAALVTGAILAAIAAAALGVAQLAAVRRQRLGSLGRQFGVAIALLVSQALVAVIAVAALMFVSDSDAVLVSLIVAFTGLVAVLAARRLAGGVLRDVEALRDGLAAVGAGRRDVHIATSGRDELAELAGEANAMIERLDHEERRRDAADRARRDLVAAVSHDLRTPITSLRLLTEAVRDEVVDDGQRRAYLGRMSTHIDALGSLIDDLFELSRIEAGDIDWSMRQVALADLVDETVGAMDAEARANGVHMHADVARPLTVARANPEKLQRVLFNLIQNAIRHTPADGSVTVRARTVGGGVEVEVADTGAGIAEEDRPKVFDALYRGGPHAARDGDGAGLGLAISRAIVEAHGGRIWLAEDAPGTCVRFSVPALA